MATHIWYSTAKGQSEVVPKQQILIHSELSFLFNDKRSKCTSLDSSSNLPASYLHRMHPPLLLLQLAPLPPSLPLPFLSPSLKTDHHCQHKNNDVQLFTYAHSLFPYELKRISPPPPLPPSLFLSAIMQFIIPPSPSPPSADEENFLITLTAFRRRRRPMDYDSVGRAQKCHKNARGWDARSVNQSVASLPSFSLKCL